MTIAKDPYQRIPTDQNASGRSFDSAELALLAQVLESGVLTSTRGQVVRELERAFASCTGADSAIACSSGSAAVHAAIAAIDPEPGEEVITSPITDMGAIAPILAQGAIPVFADVDPSTCNVTASTIGDRISDRTRAIVVTHLFGNPCDMAPIMELALSYGIPVIEDCAQAYGAMDGGRHVGSIGAIGVFSLQQGKHITCGEGGVLVTSDPEFSKRARLFINKGWDYGSAAPDHRFLAPNYRMTELQGAVALAQFERVGSFVDVRRRRAEELSSRLANLHGLRLPQQRPGSVHSFWRYVFHLPTGCHPDEVDAFAAALGRHGIAASARYTRKPAFDCEMFVEQRTFGRSRWPFPLARAEAIEYSRDRFPGTYQALSGTVVLGWNERLESVDIEHIARCCEAAYESLMVSHA